MTIQQKYRGDTIGKVIKFYDKDDNLIDPNTIEIKIYDSESALKDTLSKSDLTKVEDGVYNLAWDIPSDGEYGLWKAYTKGNVTVGALQNTEPFFFHVKEMK